VSVINDYLAHLVRLNRRPGTIYQRKRTLHRLAACVAPLELLDLDVTWLRTYTERASQYTGRARGDEARYAGRPPT
jgi:hypothetical protein